MLGRERSGKAGIAIAGDGGRDLALYLPVLVWIVAVECISLGITVLAALSQNSPDSSPAALVVIAGMVFVFAPVTLFLSLIFLDRIWRPAEDWHEEMPPGHPAIPVARGRRAHLRLVKSDSRS